VKIRVVRSEPDDHTVRYSLVDSETGLFFASDVVEVYRPLRDKGAGVNWSTLGTIRDLEQAEAFARAITYATREAELMNEARATQPTERL